MPTEPTQAQIESALRLLRESRDALIAATRDLSAYDWNFKPAPDIWSVAEIAEHVVIVEGRVRHIVSNLNTNGTEAGDDQPRLDEEIMTRIPARTTKVSAPPMAHPSGKYTGEQVLELFREGREKTIELLSSTCLRARVFPHPLFGPWDGYQWLVGAAAHTVRHVHQINEVRAACVTSA